MLPPRTTPLWRESTTDTAPQPWVRIRQCGCGGQIMVDKRENAEETLRNPWLLYPGPCRKCHMPIRTKVIGSVSEIVDDNRGLLTIDYDKAEP